MKHTALQTLALLAMTVTVAQARREVAAAENRTIVLTPDEFLQFWQALQEPVRLTPAQKKLGAIMRGEA